MSCELKVGDRVFRARLVNGRATIGWTPREVGARTIQVRYRPAAGFKPARALGHTRVRT